MCQALCCRWVCESGKEGRIPLRYSCLLHRTHDLTEKNKNNIETQLCTELNAIGTHIRGARAPGWVWGMSTLKIMWNLGVNRKMNEAWTARLQTRPVKRSSWWKGEGNCHSLRTSICARCVARHSIYIISMAPQISPVSWIGLPLLYRWGNGDSSQMSWFWSYSS